MCIRDRIDAIEARIGAFEPRERAQRVPIMIEPAMRDHRGFQRVLARMAEGRVTDVMGKAQGLGQIFVQPQRPGDAAADLRDFDAVRQPDAIVVAVGRHEDLRLSLIHI